MPNMLKLYLFFQIFIQHRAEKNDKNLKKKLYFFDTTAGILCAI